MIKMDDQTLDLMVQYFKAHVPCALSWVLSVVLMAMLSKSPSWSDLQNQIAAIYHSTRQPTRDKITCSPTTKTCRRSLVLRWPVVLDQRWESGDTDDRDSGRMGGMGVQSVGFASSSREELGVPTAPTINTAPSQRSNTTPSAILVRKIKDLTKGDFRICGSQICLPKRVS